MSRYVNSLLIIVILLSLQACSSTKYLSQPATAEFRIDGDQTEWQGRFEIPQDEKFAIGMGHDQNYLYVAINSMERSFERQLAVRGLTIWIDAKGKKHKDLGVKFEGLVPMDRRPGGRSGRSSQTERRSEMFRNNSPFKGDLDLIIVNAKGRERLGPADLLATAVAGEGGLFMEYQIPLALLGPGYAAGQTLGVGLNAEYDRSDMPARGQGGRSGGGMSGSGMSGGGQRGGGGKRGGGGQPGMSGSRPEQTDLDVWFKVELAQP